MSATILNYIETFHFGLYHYLKKEVMPYSSDMVFINTDEWVLKKFNEAYGINNVRELFKLLNSTSEEEIISFMKL